MLHQDTNRVDAKLLLKKFGSGLIRPSPDMDGMELARNSENEISFVKGWIAAFQEIEES